MQCNFHYNLRIGQADPIGTYGIYKIVLKSYVGYDVSDLFIAQESDIIYTGS